MDMETTTNPHIQVLPSGRLIWHEHEECRVCTDSFYPVNDDGVCRGCEDEGARFDASDRRL